MSKQEANIFDNPRFVSLLTRVSLALFHWRGWTHRVQLPEEKKYVLIVAPHTSNWDFMLMVPMGLLLERRVRIMMKHSAFIWPLSLLFRWLGGIPIERSSRHNYVQQLVDEFNSRDEMVLIVAPEGTRSYSPSWKRGFYHIAKQAGVPIVSCYLDHSCRVAGVLPPFYPGDDIEQDLYQIQKPFGQFQGRHPEKYAVFPEPGLADKYGQH